MTFGFEASNAEGKTTISTGFPLMKFAGKCSVVSNTYARKVGDGILFWVYWYMQYRAGIDCRIGRVVLKTPVISGDSPPLVFLYLHDGGGNIIPSSITSNGDGTWTITLCTTSDYPAPEAYCFYSAERSEASERYGVRLFGGDSSIIFDSGWPRNTFLKVQEVLGVVASPGRSFSVSNFVKPAIAFKFNHSMMFAGSPQITIGNEYLGISGVGFSYWIKFVINALGLSRAGTTYTVTEGTADLIAKQNTAYSIDAYGRVDGQTHYLPIIDAADYD